MSNRQNTKLEVCPSPFKIFSLSNKRKQKCLRSSGRSRRSFTSLQVLTPNIRWSSLSKAIFSLNYWLPDWVELILENGAWKAFPCDHGGGSGGVKDYRGETASESAEMWDVKQIEVWLSSSLSKDSKVIASSAVSAESSSSYNIHFDRFLEQ